MSLVFYFSPMSTASITHQILDELQVPHETVTLHLRKGETRTPEFLRINPNGKVPVIVHDGTPIFESCAITMYLGEAFGVERGLFPAAGPDRGLAFQWLVWTHATLGETLSRFLNNTAPQIPEDQRNAAVGETARGQVGELLGMLDGWLAGREWLVGGGFTLVDAHIWSYLMYVQAIGFPLDAHANLAAWAGRVAARPASQRAAEG